MKKLIYNPDGEKHGFILFPAKFGEKWGKIEKKEHIFIYSSDFEYIISSIKNIFPFTDPETGEEQEFFDMCGMNCIPVYLWTDILKNLQEKERYKDIKLKQFISEFCSWISEKQKKADEIMVWGTL